MADENKWAGECYRRGNDAMQKQNWDLAVEMFSTCVKLVPDNLLYRQFLRNSTKKKYNDNGKGAGTLGKTKLMGIRSRIKKAKSSEQWEEASKAVEEGLYINPWDTSLNVELAEVSQKLERGEIAKFAYMEAIRTDQKNRTLYTMLAGLLETRGEYDDAIKTWELIARMDPQDQGPLRKITDLQTKKTTHRGGYDDAGGTRDVMVNKNALQNRNVSAAPGESVEVDLKHAIRKEPDKVEHYVKLATVYRQTKRLALAKETMEKAVEVSNNDIGVIEQLEDVELLLMKFELEQQKERATKFGEDEDRKKSATMAIALRDRRVDVLTRRVERYPSNLSIKFELAELLMQIQKWTTAIPLLQRAAQDPRLKAKSYVALGKCFVYDKKLPLAKGQFERALPDLNPEAEPDTYKECYYFLGRVCEELKDPANAEKYYGQILVYDYEYKDARERLEKLQTSEA